MKNNGCVGCHQLGQLSTRTIPPALGTFASRRRRVEAPRAVGPVRAADARPAERPRRRCRSRNYGDWTDRIAKGELPHRQAAAAAGRRAQHRRHAARLDEREAVPARPDRERSPLPDRQRLRTALRIARVQLGHHPDPRSGEEHGHDVHGAGARSEHAAQPRARPRRGARRRCSRRPTGAASASGRRASTTTTRCSTATAGCGWPRRCAAPTTRRSARQGSDHPSAKAFPMERAVRHLAVLDPKTQEVHVRRHLLLARITRSSATTPTTRCGRAAAARWSAG